MLHEEPICQNDSILSEVYTTRTSTAKMSSDSTLITELNRRLTSWRVNVMYCPIDSRQWKTPPLYNEDDERFYLAPRGSIECHFFVWSIAWSSKAHMIHQSK